jgi:hypothetical protein
MPAINNLQKQLIHIGIADLGIPDEDYRMMLAERFKGATSCLELNYSQASAFIDDLKKKGFRIRRRRNRNTAARQHGTCGRTASNVVFLPTKQQLSLIEHLRQDVHWRVHDGYWRWMEKFLGRTYIKTEKEAQKVIEALKNMKAYQNRKSGAGGENATL